MRDIEDIIIKGIAFIIGIVLIVFTILNSINIILAIPMLALGIGCICAGLTFLD